jgi:MinD-like ATPase involved in chromosome partitioning or flagellar assembly
MSHIIAINSFRRGTGKSNIAANVATLLSLNGQQVALVDMDLASPSQQTLFGLKDSDVQFTLNDFLWGNCEIEQVAFDLTFRLTSNAPVKGQLYLIPASQRFSDITRVLRGDYYLHLLGPAFEQLSESLGLDTIIIDTHAGLNEETLMVFGLCNAAAILLRGDPLDYQGTAVTLDIARKLDVEQLGLVINELPTTIDPVATLSQVENKFHCNVIAALPHVPELAALASGAIFTLRHPNHPLTYSLKTIATRLTT